MTLAELLVVLAILAITSVMALQAVAPMMGQARVDSTRQTLESVANSIVSVNKSAVSGFLVDTGRLPVFSSTLTSLPPSVDELTGVYPSSATTGPPADLGYYQAIPITLNICTSATNPTATTPTTVTVSSGWNGPYLLAPSGSYTTTSTTSIIDGWGQSLPSFFYPDPTNGNGMTILSTGDPTTWTSGNPMTGQPISTTLVPSQLAASVLAVNSVNSSNIPWTPTWGASPYYYAMYGPAPNTLFSTASGTISASAGNTVEVQVGTAIGANPAPAVYRYTTPFAQSASLPTWLSNSPSTVPFIPVIGQRVFCVLDSNGNVVSGPLYRIVLPGANAVQFLVQ